MSRFIAIIAALVCSAAFAAEPVPEAKLIPRVEAVPLPDGQVSFQHAGRELTRYHFGDGLRRPFWYPIIGPSGRSHTRMGHPRDPLGHSHHNSVWISHHIVNGYNFWGDRGEKLGRIVHDGTQVLHDGDESAWMLSMCRWVDDAGKTIMLERRRTEVIPYERGEWMMIIDLQFEALKGASVTIAQDPFGMIGVRMAKSIGVHDGGGRILNSEGSVNEEPIFRKPARWCDYSGRMLGDEFGGVTLMDHPSNPNHPAPFHVRNDGWMGTCLTLDKPIVIEAGGEPLRLRYGLWVHAGVPDAKRIDPVWRQFADMPLAEMTPPKRR